MEDDHSDDVNPFAEMILKNSTSLNSNISSGEISIFPVKQIYENVNENFEDTIKTEIMSPEIPETIEEYQEQNQFHHQNGNEEENFSSQYSNGYHESSQESKDFSSNGHSNDDDNSSSFFKEKKKNGRPIGSKNKKLKPESQLKKPRKHPEKIIKKSPSSSPRPSSNEEAIEKTPEIIKKQKIQKSTTEKLPKMKPNVHYIKLSGEDVEKLKTVECFIQQGVCFQIAPELNQCKECHTHKKRKYKVKREVECRFYQFRKLRFNGDVMEVAGFLSNVDPIEVDRNIWLPGVEKSKFRINVPDARFILQHVGDELCYIIEKERHYLNKYGNYESIIWKRLIDQVSEICDICSTTLFNIHFICSVCGISLCVDCIDESEDQQFDISCSIEDKKFHSMEDLKLTQIIVNDSMDQLQLLLHESCILWNIQHKCDLKCLTVDQLSKNLAQNTLLELTTKKTTLAREPIPKISVIDMEKIEQLSTEKNGNSSTADLNVDEELMEYFNLSLKTRNEMKNDEKVCKPIRHFTEKHREVIISIPRIMCHANSQLMYPDVPHSWLCAGKLLRLHDPNNSGNMEFFEKQWERGQPVLISNVSKNMQRDLWTPESFSREFGRMTSDFINCVSGNIVRNRKLSEFWDGYEYVNKRLVDKEGQSTLLKLKDWPPDRDFKKLMPTRFEDIMKNLPVNSYTNRTGELNIVKYLPSCFLHPDLGPKGYFAYGDPFHLKEGTTNLHLDVSDACNVICYVGFPRDQDIDSYVQQGLEAMIEADCDRSNIMRVIDRGEIPGAIWHIYHAADADRIRDFLNKIAYEKGMRISPGHDVIHDQNWYLDKELRERLYKEYSVEGYAIVQCVGDCIVLPAGTPHQVRNIYSCIKVAEDFVSPQQIAHCLHLTNEFRRLTKTHTNNEEKINAKNVAYHSVKEAIASLDVMIQRKKMFMNKWNDRKDYTTPTKTTPKRLRNQQNCMEEPKISKLEVPKIKLEPIDDFPDPRVVVKMEPIEFTVEPFFDPEYFSTQVTNGHDEIVKIEDIKMEIDS